MSDKSTIFGGDGSGGTNKRYVYPIRCRAKDATPCLGRVGGPDRSGPVLGAQHAERGDDPCGANASGVAVVEDADRDGDPARDPDAMMRDPAMAHAFRLRPLAEVQAALTTTGMTLTDQRRVGGGPGAFHLLLAQPAADPPRGATHLSHPTPPAGRHPSRTNAATGRSGGPPRVPRTHFWFGRRLPDGTPLPGAVAEVDAEARPDYFMIVLIDDDVGAHDVQNSDGHTEPNAPLTASTTPPTGSVVGPHDHVYSIRQDPVTGARRGTACKIEVVLL